MTPIVDEAGSNPQRTRRRLRDEEGTVTVFVVILASAVLLFGGLVLDGGLALSAKIRALGEAQEAARAGAQAIDLGAYRANGSVHLLPDQARALAQNYLAAAGASGTTQVEGTTVTVTVTTTYPTQLLTLAGLSSITLTSTGSAQPQRGVTAPEP